jgi:hypothetical protein
MINQINIINIIRWKKSWRLVIKGKKRALKVFNDYWYLGRKTKALHEIEVEAMKWAIRHLPAAIVIHKEDGTVAKWYTVREGL